MRPVSLTFSGLRSYRDATTIDFSRLDLFAIIGDTGAGKSTIIEALSLALYGRKSWSGGSNLADMIADGATTMRVALTFVAGGEQWTVTRARHRNASAPVDKLVAAAGGGNVDGSRAVTERITELVGLTHEQFTRAVVLPQGRFDELLRATEKQRTEILSSILGLGDVAATRGQAERLRDVWNERAIEARARRAHLPADPVAELAAASRRAADADVRVGALTAAREAAVGHDRRATATGRALDRVAGALAAVVAPVGDPAAELRAAHARAAELHAARRAAAAAAEEADAALSAIDARAAAVRDGFSTRDRMVAASEAVLVLADSVDKDLATAAALDAELAAHRAAPPPTEVDPELVAAEAAASRIVDEAATALGAAEQTARRAAEAWRAHLAAREAQLAAVAARDAARAPVEVAAAVVAAAEAEVRAAEQRLADAARTERAALVAGAVASVAAGCGAGDDCPVCGRELPDDFRPPLAPDDGPAREALARADAEVAAARSARDAAARAAFEAEHRLTTAGVAVDVAAAACDATRRVLSEGGLDDTAPDPLAPSLETVQQAARVLDAARGTQAGAGQALAVATAGLAASRRAHDDRAASIGADLAAARARVAEHAALVERLPAPWRPTPDRAAAEAVLARLATALAALDGLEVEREAARQAAAAGHAEVHAIGGRLSSEVALPATRAVAALDDRRTRTAALAAALADAGELAVADVGARQDLDELPGGDDPSVVAALATLADVAAADAAVGAAVVRHAERAVAELAAAHEAARTELAGVLRTVAVPDVDALHAALGRADAEREAAVAAVAAAEAAAAEAVRIDAVRAVLDPFVADLKVLAIALRDTNFMSHLVRARESELLAEATRRLRDITAGRFGFTAGFGVVNVASGEVRTPDTLSGGERFQAALALALGLVEIASRGGGRLDAVFVDEGFGSLDSGALDTALDALGKVAGGGKMVALISHLRPVAEYVDTVLHVTRDDVLGSRIDVLDSEAREQLLADDIRSGLTT